MKAGAKASVVAAIMVATMLGASVAQACLGHALRRPVVKTVSLVSR